MFAEFRFNLPIGETIQIGNHKALQRAQSQLDEEQDVFSETFNVFITDKCEEDFMYPQQRDEDQSRFGESVLVVCEL